MRQDKILAFEDNVGPSFSEFMALRWQQRRGETLPASVSGAVTPYVNQGRWVIDCPNPACSSAVNAPDDPAGCVYACSYCGNPENEGSAYSIVYPKERAYIEAELLKRPSRDGNPMHAFERNWVPGQTVSDLAAEAQSADLYTAAGRRSS